MSRHELKATILQEVVAHGPYRTVVALREAIGSRSQNARSTFHAALRDLELEGAVVIRRANPPAVNIYWIGTREQWPAEQGPLPVVRPVTRAAKASEESTEDGDELLAAVRRVAQLLVLRELRVMEQQIEGVRNG